VSAAVAQQAASTCARCGARFGCGRDDPNGCWCAALPALPAAAIDRASGCLCPSCLREAVARSAAQPAAGIARD
jgi:hypothetical protein